LEVAIVECCEERNLSAALVLVSERES